MVVHGHTLFLYAPCCACRSSAPLRGALLSCVDKKVTKEATRGGTEVDPIENLWFRIPSPRIKIVLPGTPPDKNSSQLCFLSSNIRSNSDLSISSISEFVRRGDLWSPAKCFEFAVDFYKYATFYRTPHQSRSARQLLLKEKPWPLPCLRPARQIGI